MKTTSPKTFLFCLTVTLCLLMVAGNSCDRGQAAAPPATPQIKTQSPLTLDQAAETTGLAAAVEKVCLGQFDQARQVLADQDDSAQAVQLKTLLNGHDQLQQLRQEQRHAAYQEQLDELKKLKEETADKDVYDANDIGDTMLAVVRAREYADEADKDEVLSDPFVRKMLKQMQTQADENERQGKWLDAYTDNYLWLTALHEDNETYRDKSEELTELATVELSFKDSSCGETAKERYADITVAMFLRALHLLENNYVAALDDCGEMTRKGLKRCLLIGTVLERTQEELAWSASPASVGQWTEGINAMLRQVELDVEAGKEITTGTLAELFQDVLALGAETIRLPQEVLIAQFTEASFSALDPFTNLIWPWNVKDFEKSMTQQFSGIGVEISKATGVLKIGSLLPDTPAYRSGLDADDEILAVDGESTDDMTIYCAVSKITGPKGTKVDLTIRRPSTGKTWDVTITRAKIVVDPLRGWTRTPDGEWDYLIDPDNRIGYIRLTSFTENTGPDLDSVLKTLEKKGGLNGVIIDLRFNGGGYLQAAADVVDMFVQEGVIVKSNPRQGFATYEIAHRNGTHPDYPLVVLINGSSASASEIVAGALQDVQHQRATLVGQRSYGKGSVQVVTGYTGDGSQMKYTVAYYHLPSDQRVKNRYQIEKLGRKDWGIAPDVEVKMLSNELKSMIDIQRDNDILFRGGHEENGEQTKRHTLTETIQADPQLATSLMVVRSKILMQGKTLVLNETTPAVQQAASMEVTN